MSLRSGIFGRRHIEDVPPTELAAALYITEYARSHGHPGTVLKVWDGEGWVVYDDWLDRESGVG